MPSSASLGTLYGISVGPGDPELITIKGIKLLEKCPIVAFPAGLRNQPGIAQKIVTPWLKPHQIQLSLNFPYVQDESILRQAWQVAATAVWQYLQTGQNVAFACEGDVNFYSTFTYLAQTLQQLHPEALVQTISGICSPIAAVSALGIPLTIRNQRLAILPVLYNVAELESALNWADVVVLMKVSSVYEQVWEILQRNGLLNNTYVVERATLPNQVIYQGLGDRPHLKLPYFSLMIVENQKSRN